VRRRRKNVNVRQRKNSAGFKKRKRLNVNG